MKVSMMYHESFLSPRSHELRGKRLDSMKRKFLQPPLSDVLLTQTVVVCLPLPLLLRGGRVATFPNKDETLLCTGYCNITTIVICCKSKACKAIRATNNERIRYLREGRQLKIREAPMRTKKSAREGFGLKDKGS